MIVASSDGLTGDNKTVLYIRQIEAENAALRARVQELEALIAKHHEIGYMKRAAYYLPGDTCELCHGEAGRLKG